MGRRVQAGRAKGAGWTGLPDGVMDGFMRGATRILAVMTLGWAGASASPARGSQAPARHTLRAFEARLEASNSATLVLQSWCADHRLADPPAIRALRVHGVEKPASREVRRRLHADPGETLRYRRVQLVCGRRVLSKADNWYRPGLLTPGMNRQLDETDTPFGIVVRPMGFHRHTLGVDWLSSSGVARRRTGAGTTGEVLRHRAVLATPQGAPFSYVVETYTAEILGDGDTAAGAVSR